MMLITKTLNFFNVLISGQPEILEKLKNFSGRVVFFNFDSFVLKIRIRGDGLLENFEINSADVIISVKQTDILLILLNFDKLPSFVKVTGDADFAKVISEVFNDFKFDLEEQISNLTGEIFARKFVKSSTKLILEKKRLKKNVLESICEYFLEENPILLYKRDGKAFAHNVAKLRDDIDRTEKRILLIEQSYESIGR